MSNEKLLRRETDRDMSALGQNRKTSLGEHMFSALPLKADVAQRGRQVRFVPNSGIRV